MTQRLHRELIGNVGVDSGQLMVIDPCYLTDQEQWKLGGFPEEGSGYDTACRISLSEQSCGIMNYALGHPGLAAVFSSGYGDGNYPVYAYKNGDGRIVKIEVVMD